MSFLGFPSPEERDRARVRGMSPDEYLRWNRALRDDYLDLGNSHRMGRWRGTLRPWMVPAVDETTACAGSFTSEIEWRWKPGCSPLEIELRKRAEELGL